MAVVKTNHMTDINDREELNNFAQDIIDRAKSKGADSVEVGLGYAKGLSVDVRMRELDKLEHHQDKSLTIVVYLGKKKSAVSINDTSKASVDEAIASALNIAKYAEEDEFAGIAEKELLAKNIKDLDLYHPFNVTAEEAIKLAKDAESYALDYDPRINNSDGASFSSLEKCRVYGNSNGFIGSYPSTSYYLSTVAIAKERDCMERDYDYTVSRNFQDLQSAKQVGTKAAENTISRLGAMKVPTSELPILFSAKCATGFIGHFLSASSGGAIYRNSSFLLDHLDKEVFPNFINIFERPHILGGLGSCPFDADGLETTEQNFIESGVLQKYLLSVYSGRRLKMKPTANSGGVHNLFVQANKEQTRDVSDILKDVGKCLVINEVMGQGVNIVTGDYSRGASGFLVENGKIKHPVSEITIAGNLKNMFKNIKYIGTDIEKRGNINVGSILVDNMTVAGN